MSDQPKEAPAEAEVKKKSSKLPMIVALVLFLAGGGFFVMKGRGGSAPKKPQAPQLGAIEPMKEMLVNLAGGTYYLKTEIALHMVKDYKKEDLEKNKEAVTDAVLLCLKSKKISDLQTPDQLRELKHEIATDVNQVLGDKKDGQGEAGASEAKDKNAKDDADKPKVPDDYDSDTGPVLKVYFTSFATQ